jgi:hypothetical protein
MALGRHGEPGNLWRDVRADGDDAASPVFDTHLGSEIQVFGAAEGAYMMRLQYSQDGATWYNGERMEPDGDGHFSFIVQGVQARYVRLQALRGPDFTAFGEADTDSRREPMRLNATLVAKTTR